VVLLILAGLWAVVLVPPLLRARRTERSGDSIGDFTYRLDVLGRTNGRQQPAFQRGHLTPTPPQTQLRMRATAAERAAKRRRDVVSILIAVVAVTFLAASLSGMPLAWGVHFFADTCLVAYLALWAWLRTMLPDRIGRVHYLPPQRAPELALRRTGSS
jgi:hypothetical protein